MMLVAIVLLSLLVTPAWAANHYIRDGATGSAPCSDWSDGNACDVLPATLIRGDTYYVADGAYAAYTFDDAVSGTTLITVRKATIADHGTATGWLDIYGDGAATFANLTFDETGYWLVDGVTGGGPGSWKTGFGFVVDYAANSNGIEFRCVNNTTVRHVQIDGPHVNGSGGAGQSSDGFWFRTGVLGGCSGDNTNITISYFYTDNLGLAPFSAIPNQSGAGGQFVAEYGYIGGYYGVDPGFHSEIASQWDNLNGTVIYRYNLFAYITATGGLMWDNSDNTATAHEYVYGNVFYFDDRIAGNGTNQGASGEAGWIGGWSCTPEEMSNVHVFNNTFLLNPSHIPVLSGDTGACGTGNEVKNNLFYNIPNTGGDPAIWQTISHNHFISTTTIGTNTSTSTGNPFQDYFNNDFRLTAGTTAGTALASPYNVDMYGNTRGADGTWDRGAVEFVAGGGGSSHAISGSVALSGGVVMQ